MPGSTRTPKSGKKPTPADFPFPYLEHGVLALDGIGKGGGAYIAFQKPITKKDRLEIRRGCPEPIGGMWNWGSTLVSCESMGDIFDFMLAEHYAGSAGNKAKPPRMDEDPRDSIDEAAAARFAADVEKWARGVHAKFPLAFFLGPVHAETPSPWGNWSEEVLRESMVPWLEAYADANAKDLVEDDDRDTDPDDGVFDFIAMSCILQHVPKPKDKALAKRLKDLEKRFPL